MFFVKTYKRLNTPFLVKSNFAAKFLESKGILNIHTVGVGIDLDALTCVDKTESEFVKNIQRKQDTINLLYVGRFEPRRDIMFIYEVADKLKKKNLKFKLIMVGAGKKKYVSLCKEKINDLALNDDIIRTERMEQKYLSELYKKCDFFLLPTHYEIFGMVQLEAMYYGLICLTTENGGSNMLIQTGENGFILPHDAELWVKTIVENKNRIDFRDKAHEEIKSAYTWEALADGFERVYLEKAKE